MKVHLRLNSRFFNNEQSAFSFDNLIEIDWPFPFLPRSSDIFDFENIVNEQYWPYFYEGNLCWNVGTIEYTKEKETFIIIFWLDGE